jgi:hypothetical protein
MKGCVSFCKSTNAPLYGLTSHNFSVFMFRSCPYALSTFDAVYGGPRPVTLLSFMPLCLNVSTCFCFENPLISKYLTSSHHPNCSGADAVEPYPSNHNMCPASCMSVCINKMFISMLIAKYVLIFVF